MAVNNVLHTETIVSNNAAAVNGTPFRVSGQALDWQSLGPAAFHRLEVSMDKLNWAAATDVDAAGITALGAVYRIVRERPEWVRNVVLTDIGAPQDFVFVIGVMKDDG